MSPSAPDLAEERRWRIRCYWSWLALPAIPIVVGGILFAVGRRDWMLRIAPSPLWIIAAVHLRYYLGLVRWRHPRAAPTVLGLGLAVAGPVWALAGATAAISCALGLPLLLLHGLAQEAPDRRSGPLRLLLVSLPAVVRPFAVLLLLAGGWVLATTSGGASLPPGHRHAWWAALAVAAALVLVPTVIWRLEARRLRRTAPPAG